MSAADDVVAQALAAARKVIEDARAAKPDLYARRDTLMAQVATATAELNSLNAQIAADPEVTKANQVIRTLTGLTASRSEHRRNLATIVSSGGGQS
jgi:chromosome segregation ATPase